MAITVLSGAPYFAPMAAGSANPMVVERIRYSNSFAGKFQPVEVFNGLEDPCSISGCVGTYSFKCGITVMQRLVVYITASFCGFDEFTVEINYRVLVVIHLCLFEWVILSDPSVRSLLCRGSRGNMASISLKLSYIRLYDQKLENCSTMVKRGIFC